MHSSSFSLGLVNEYVLVRQIMSEDDDIIAGPQKMSLRCPVSDSSIGVYMRT